MERKTRYFDPMRDGISSSRWKTVGGTPVASGDQILLSQASILELADVSLGDLRLELSLPTAPTAGDERQFGFKSFSSGSYALFDISGTTFSAKVSDENGHTDSTTLVFNNDWVAEHTVFQIVFSASFVKFYINSSCVATFTGEDAPNKAMSIYVKNDNADSMLFYGYDLLGAHIYEDAGFPSEITVSTVSLPGTGVAYAPFQNNSFQSANVKSVEGRVYSFTVTNTTGAERYFQLHNTTTTLSGSETAAWKVPVPANSSVSVGAEIFGSNGKLFADGITVANSTTLSTYTAGTAGDLVLDLFYDGVGGGYSGYVLLETGDALLLEDGSMMAIEN